MIRKAGYAILAVLTYGILESLLLGYKYYIIFVILTFFMVAFEVIYFNFAGSKAINNVSVTRNTDTLNFRKNREFKINLHFENNNSHPMAIHFFDEAIDVLEISGKTLGTITIPKKGIYDISYSVTPRYIGKYELGNIKINISDQFHLASIEKNNINEDVHAYISLNGRHKIQQKRNDQQFYLYLWQSLFAQCGSGV